VIFEQKDFENTLIVYFVTKDKNEKEDVDYKVNWKDLEVLVKEKFDKLKVVYTRSDKYDGHLAISSNKLFKPHFEALCALKDHLIGGKKFDFKKLEGEELKDFW